MNRLIGWLVAAMVAVAALAAAAQALMPRRPNHPTAIQPGDRQRIFVAPGGL